VFRIELLPAAIGDAIWIEYGDPARPRRIVIDGGPAPSYEKGLLARVLRLKKNDVIDLLVVTHIDADHIDGAVILLQHADEIGVRFGEIWFNAWPQLAPLGPETFAPQQGEFLAALLDRPGLRDRWNTRTEGQAIVLSDTEPLLEHTLPDDARLTLLSPGLAQIKRLRARWNSAMRDFCGDTAEALRRLKTKGAYQPPPLQPVFGGASPGGDRSPANASSIAFLLEHDGAACLFAADAFPRVLAASLRRLSGARNPARPMPIRLDACKLSHHAGLANVSDELVSAVECSRWLVSTSGDEHHPNRGVAQLVAKHAPGSEFFCNYKSEITERFADTSSSPLWRTHYPGEGAPAGETGGIVLDLLPVKQAKATSPATRDTAGEKKKKKKTREARRRPRRAAAGRRRE
jgi:hypothetical protein